MIADIAHGHVDAADVLFLIAVILFGLAFVLNVLGAATASLPPRFNSSTIMLAGLTSLALAWLLL